MDHHQLQVPPRTPPPRTPTQSPGYHARSLVEKSPRQIPPPPLQTTPRTPGKTSNVPQPSPRNWIRQNPPPPPPKRSNSQHGSSGPLNYGLSPPYPTAREIRLHHENPPLPHHRLNRSFDNERQRTPVAVRKKSFHESDRQLQQSDMIDSFHEYARQRSNSGGESKRRERSNSGGESKRRERSKSPGDGLNYSRANSVPTVRTNYKEDSSYLVRSNSAKTNRRDEQYSRGDSTMTYARRDSRDGHVQNSLLDSQRDSHARNSVLDPIPWRPDPDSDSFADNERNNLGNEVNFHSTQTRRHGDDLASGSESYTAFERFLESLMCIFPKVEPLPWSTYFLLLLWCALPPSGFITFFTAMGFGEQVYYAIADEFGEYANALAYGLASFIFVLYMLDADQWSSVIGTVFLDFSVLVVVAGAVLLVLLLAYRFPYGMICLFALFNPLWLLTVKLILYTDKSTRVFVSWLSGPLLTVSALIGMAWALWVFADPSHQWNEVARIKAASYSQCEPDYELYPDCRKAEGSNETCFYMETINGRDNLVFPAGCSELCANVYDGCLNGFILWVGPVLVSMTIFFLSFFCTFFREEIEREKDILNFGKIWIFILFAMWVTASLSGTAAGVTTALVALTLASFVASAVFLTVSFSKEEREQNAAAVMERLREKYNKHLDVIRGLFIWRCAPIILVYSGFSMMNQFVRRSEIFPCSQPARGEDGHIDTYTFRTRAHINVLKTWDRAKVYTYAVYWGIAYMVLEVIIAKLTVVFLSWLIVQVSDLGLFLVTGIIWCAGLIMFLLPPIPGVPVYLTIGVVLPAQGYEQLGWLGAISYSVMVGLLLKLFASAIQQKVIGEHLSHYVRVRQLVGINSTVIRAMRLVVGENGLSFPKVALLVGGPDWPTSVLCGIMRLSLPQIMLGTVPVIFLIIPTCLTGTFLYMASMVVDGNAVYPWARTLSTISAAFTAIVQFGAMIVAAYYLEQAADKRVAEIESIPLDEDVQQADEAREMFTKCYEDVTRWSTLLWVDKSYLRISLGCSITSSYMVQIFSERCFVTHSLTDSIEENLEGNAANLFLPLGWVAVSLFMASCMFLILFQKRCNQKARRLVNGPLYRQLSTRSNGANGLDLSAHSGRRQQKAPMILNTGSQRRLSSSSIDIHELELSECIDPPGMALNKSRSSSFSMDIHGLDSEGLDPPDVAFNKHKPSSFSSRF